MLPMYQRLNGPPALLHVSFAKLAVFTVSMPLVAFFFCILWSVLFNFVESTYTHCEVANYLPSVSAAIGSYEPQRFIWRLSICLHLPMRLVVAKFYMDYYNHNLRREKRIYGALACALNIVEDFALFCLSLWTSADDYIIHRNAFVVFIACSECYMLISVFLNKHAHQMSLLPNEQRSLRFKHNLFTINVFAFACAAYCFLRHNSRCEPGVYTLFALFEYVVVLTNMGFHMTAYWDFRTLSVAFDWTNGLYMTQF